jgi:FixJ family two-component response regulator
VNRNSGFLGSPTPHGRFSALQVRLTRKTYRSIAALGNWLPKRRNPLIAIVDDDAAVRRALGRLLEASGYSTRLFASADEFLASDQIEDTSCLITDVQMPGLSGFDLQKQLLAEGYRIPTIFITAFPDENAKARAMNAGAIGFLRKPFKHDELIIPLNNAVKRT